MCLVWLEVGDKGTHPMSDMLMSCCLEGFWLKCSGLVRFAGVMMKESYSRQTTKHFIYHVLQMAVTFCHPSVSSLRVYGIGASFSSSQGRHDG